MTLEWRDDAPANLAKLAVGRCLIGTMDRARWIELGLLTNTQEQIEGHPRLLRSLHWNDDDYDQCVLQVVPVVLGETHFDNSLTDLTNFDVVAEFLDLPAWLAEHDQTLFERLILARETTAMPDGTVLSAAEEAAQRLEVDEMRRQVERIRRDHASDPEALIGQSKELIETTCKTVLGLTGHGEETQISMPSLVKRTLIHLGLDPAKVSEHGGDPTEARALRRLMGGMASVLNGADELRNARGTGHGRSRSLLVDDALARLTVGLVLPAIVYLCETWERRTSAAIAQPQKKPLMSTGTVRIGDIVKHETFGEGQVTDLNNPGDSNEVVAVDFGTEVGTKRLLVRYSPMVVVQRG